MRFSTIDINYIEEGEAELVLLNERELRVPSAEERAGLYMLIEMPAHAGTVKFEKSAAPGELDNFRSSFTSSLKRRRRLINALHAFMSLAIDNIDAVMRDIFAFDAKSAEDVYFDAYQHVYTAVVP